MTLRLSSDLIAGVLQAANPSRARIAAAKLGGQSFDLAIAAAQSSPVRVQDIPNDLVLDVMQAADPQRLAAASAKLDVTAEETRQTASVAVAPDSYTKFEGFLLRSAFEDILPTAESGAFGEGYAGGVWRSMAAEQFANLFADGGGIGIAKMLRARAASGDAGGQPASSAQWPYFEQPKLSAFAT